MQENKTTMQPEQSRRYVLHDVIQEILVRLPIKSLLRCTLVSKLWEASIKSSSFISAYHSFHMKTSINNTRSRSSHLISISNPLMKYDENCTLIPRTIDLGVPTSIPLPRLWEGVEIAGSSEGLICLRKKPSIIYLWNPFTRVMKTLPKCEIQCNEYLGFGFAPQDGDHRVVKLMREGTFLTKVEMYSLASDSWRGVKPPSVSFEKFGLYSNLSFKGSIYWLVAAKITTSQIILRFDLEAERFEVIEVEVGREQLSKLMVVDGFLVLLKELQLFCRELIRVSGYINKESGSGLSSWVRTKSVEVLVLKDVHVGFWKTGGGHIKLECREPYLHSQCVAAYDICCDGTNLSFKWRDLEIHDNFMFLDLIPINETLFLLDKSGLQSTIEGYIDS